MSQQQTSFAGGAAAQHNPHPDFKSVESSRPPFDPALEIRYTKTIDPDWKYGSGANALGRSDTPHVAIDPHEEGRPAGFNYKLLISSIVPRPIAFLSTRSSDGTVENLAPFSYFNMVNHDPPLFVVGFAASVQKPKDSLRNLLESKECVINIISEGFLEAANATSVNAPYGVSEWDVSGLTPVYDCKHVKAARVKEAIFSVEGTLDMFKEYDSRATAGKKSGVVAIIEGRNFWVREDAINKQRNMVDPAVLRPVSRLGGITYGRTTEVYELPRADWEANIGGEEGFEKIKKGEV
ncbi:nitrilotriacetate monooxygenase component b [Colletotrichum plurivorum]|uniref:Nitrilotriacetate monooxygenase component b n=1 Tax=Colletotrichum plurivorum TaxID=2175906 RepID=A0A8H6KWZ3_9PEZI|nr:nitrilotriacetate monooxygenase component b [Colletotrichum plurivorum]